MKTKLLSIILLSSLTSYSFAQAQVIPFPPLTTVSSGAIYTNNVIPFSSNNGLNSVLNGATNALEGAGSAVGSAVSTVARSGLTQQAIMGGIYGGVIGAVVSVAVGGLLNWGIGKLSSNPDGTVSLTNQSGSQSALTGFSAGDLIWQGSVNAVSNAQVFSSDPSSFIYYYIKNQTTLPSNAHYYVAQLNNCSIDGSNYYCNTVVAGDGTVSSAGHLWLAKQVNAPVGCPTGELLNGSACIPDPTATSSQQTQILQMNQLLSALSQQDLNSQVSATDLSTLTNALLQNLNNQTGQNYPMTTPANFPNPTVKVSDLLNPITSQTVASDPLTGSNPTTRGVAVPSSSTSPSSTTTTTTGTDSNGNPTSTTTVNVNAKVDLGSDPGITSPVLESTPTANNILDPIFNMMPRTYVLNGNTGTCPSPNFQVLGHNYNFNMMCSILDQNSGTISAIMFFFFTVISVLILLSA